MTDQKHYRGSVRESHMSIIRSDERGMQCEEYYMKSRVLEDLVR